MISSLPHRSLSALCINAGKLPQHDGRGADLDQTVQPETSKRDRTCFDRRDGEHGDTHHVPAELRRLQQATAPEQLAVTRVDRGARHRVKCWTPTLWSQSGSGAQPQRLGRGYSRSMIRVS